MSKELALDDRDVYIVGRDGPEDESHELWDERAFLPVREQTKKSIDKYGQRVPIIVRESANKKFEVVDGRGRTLAIRDLNKERIANDQQAIKVRAILDSSTKDPLLASTVSTLTNAVRFGDDPLVEVDKTIRYLARLLQLDHLDVSGVVLKAQPAHIDLAATVFGVSDQTIRNRIKIAKLDPAIHRLIKAGKVGLVQGMALSELPRGQQLIKALDIAEKKEAGEKTTAEDVKQAVRATQQKEEYDQKKASAIPTVLLRRCLALAKADGDKCRLSDQHMVALRVSAGELPVDSISGLPELINRVEAGERPEKGLKKARTVNADGNAT